MKRIQKGLYDSAFEHDACGIGAVISIDGIKSHKVVDDALKIVEKLEHRAGKDATGETGDGVGIMLQISHAFFSSQAKEKGIDIGGEREYAVGMFFFPQETLARNQAKKLFEVIAKREGLELLFWRTVPTHPDVLGEKAVSCMPYIEQVLIKRPPECKTDIEFERKLYIARRVFEQSTDNIYVSSLSCRTIVYKGMFLVHQLRKFYNDLQSEEYKSAIALVHSRFSTNTNPSWERAHPNRYILHNGEINTIRGNIDRMLSREETMDSPIMRDDMDKVLPVVEASGSDSSMLDNTIEFLVMNDIDLPLAMMMVIPEPWRNVKGMSRQKRDFYEYYSTMMEPWDGPAAILFSDGDVVGATLDRNGLRPSRYYITDDGYLVLSSEVGVLDIDQSKIIKKSRLEPGKMLLVDTNKKRVIDDSELKDYYASRQPYGEWVDANLVHLDELSIPNVRAHTHTQRERDLLYKAFGYTYEDVKTTILPMAKNAIEQTAAMGVDIPLAVLSDKHQPLFNYFKQIFAQVTNPPIDAIREEIVTDTCVYIGSDGNLLEEKAENCNVLQIKHPILTNIDMLKIRNMNKPGFKVQTISLLYYISTPLERALDQLFVAVDRAYKNGNNIIILSDKGVDENHVAIPSLLAVSAVENHLIRTKKRTAVSIIIETGEPRSVHHFATLLGFGARAVCPYLAFESIEELINLGILDKDLHVAIDDYCEAVLHGIVKIASKMGISTLQSYQSAQIFEVIGIEKNVIDKYFANTTSRVGGIGLAEIDEGVKWRHSHAFDPLGLGIDITLDSSGDHKLRSGNDKDDHLYSPETIIALQRATREGDYEKFKQYTKLVDSEVPHTLRGLLELKYDENGGIPLEEVEPVENIVKRFKTGAMSYGSISQEAHECLAQAMNTLGGKSNSGEGGELPERLKSDCCSAIKQVASGRFGVTSEYLNSAKEIQIKMAQGAKPGEGGHLPGKKVYPWIAKTRYSTPGVSLISPPPHHDIYSIEDLAQLIYDLKNANRDARISVKLVSECGVGTIAAGVAKAGAQVVLISGYDGGTGAAPKSSIHNAGLPWELGVAETHQTLIMNGLRSRVIIEADGKLMSGRDVAIAAMLGAEEFGFATAPLICMGCMMMRVCNLDTCPVGIATQNPELRKRFTGKKEYVINFMTFIAMQLREIMAKLGIRTVDELVGRSDLLSVRDKTITERASKVDMSAIINNPFGSDAQLHFNPNDIFDFELQDSLDVKTLLPALIPHFEKKEKASVSTQITSTNRTAGTILGSEITKRFGSSLKDDTYTVNFKGGAGQSLGAFIPKGLTLKVEGDSNDYFGKGLSGGKLVIYPPKEATFKPEDNIIIGNVALYGATGGCAYIAGIAGERFCVRNSGATAVVEGVGDHGCEYMTGGMVVILGRTGKNFAAGMSGGIAYVLDEDHDLYLKINKDMITMQEVCEKYEYEELYDLIHKHYKETKSPKAKRILDDFDTYKHNFKKIVPIDYAKMLQSISNMEEKGMSREQAEIEAFYANLK
ncbi:MAG: glutamate synthase large subunit [Faecalibacterium sp.]|nr:glutamate synthase large subunit [Ruminococcus sp.]MCM1391944.1 glutamate synthase large subunit [Ruminococcus sp.]MCM1484972.1 glutamate synthase large subunit [Faecalibacterium sp.]